MFIDFQDIIKCEVCRGYIELDSEETVKDFSRILDIKTSEVFSKVEDIINVYLVYRCTACGHLVKYTYKELEKELRKALTAKLLFMSVKGEITHVKALIGKYFVYCGKCNGFDGQGSCPISVFEKCEIKRFPLNEL
jgi:hypothetical protein